MKRMFTTLAVSAAALLLVAGGGGSETFAQAAKRSVSNPNLVAVPGGIVMNRIDSRLGGTRGLVEVWVSLDQNSVAAQRAALAEASGLTTDGAVPIKSTALLRKAVADHRKRIGESQAALANSIASLGGQELRARSNRA